MTVLSYKVLAKDGTSAHGGQYQYTLPHFTDDGDWKPGTWTDEIDDPIICRRGYHLTVDPMQWPVVGMRVFSAEGDPATPVDTRENKSVYPRVRLLAEHPDMVPEYWHNVERFITEDIPAVPWFQQIGTVNPAWVHIVRPTWNEAWRTAFAATGSRMEGKNSAWARASDVSLGTRDSTMGESYSVAWEKVTGMIQAAIGVAWDGHLDSSSGFEVSWAASQDAALFTRIQCLGYDIKIDERHRQHARDRWAVWQAGYGLIGDVNGILYTYGTNEPTKEGDA
jgi:hypothetical protein